MALVSAKGVAKPFEADGQPYSAFGDLTPALHSFRLTFPGGVDREITLIRVLAGGQSEDITPDADLAPADVPDGRLQVNLQDKDPSGEKFEYNVAHSVMRIPGARRYQIRDVGCVGACTRTIPSSAITDSPFPVPGDTPLIALVGFKVFFTGGRDRQLDRIGVWFNGRDLNVALRDQNASPREPFGYLVDFVVIPTAGLNVSTGIARGTATEFGTYDLPAPSQADFMLTGWEFDFRPGDREIRDIGVVRSGQHFNVYYRDSSGGEEFDWRVEWAHVAPQVFAPPIA